MSQARIRSGLRLKALLLIQNKTRIRPFAFDIPLIKKLINRIIIKYEKPPNPQKSIKNRSPTHTHPHSHPSIHSHDPFQPNATTSRITISIEETRHSNKARARTFRNNPNDRARARALHLSLQESRTSAARPPPSSRQQRNARRRAHKLTNWAGALARARPTTNGAQLNFKCM